MEIRPYQPSDELGVIQLWSTVLPDSARHNDPALSLNNKMAVGDGLLLVALVEETIVGTVMGGYDGHRGWVYSLAVLPEYRNRGIGTALCRRLEEMLIDRGCLKLNLQVRSDNVNVIAFYEKLGYVVEDRANLGKRLYS